MIVLSILLILFLIFIINYAIHHLQDDNIKTIDDAYYYSSDEKINDENEEI